MKEFQGKVAVVTGAASGIGCAVAERCAQERRNDPVQEQMSPQDAALSQAIRQMIQSGIATHEVADLVFQAIRDETF